jgi:enamine deaminase RidA (YjgF/YER057c/UK114 family)
MQKQFINPPGLPKWEQSFSQVVVVHNSSTSTIYLSGQVSVDQENNLIGAGDLSVQAEQAFANLERALAAAGATPADVVKINIYIKNYQPTDAATVREAMRRVFRHKELPASTWLGVETLALEGLLIEVDAVAVVEAGR